MGRWKRFGIIVILYATDHRPRHVHVFEDGQRPLKFDVESCTPIEGKLTTRARRALEVCVRKVSLRNPKFKDIKPNYRRRMFEITLQEGRRVDRYVLPFSVFEGMDIGPRNRVAEMIIDKEINNQGAFFTLDDGSRGSFPADLVLYHCDSSYEWSPLNQVRRKLQGKLGGSKLAVRVVADAFQKSPSQVLKLLEAHRSSQHLGEVLRLADLAGYHIALKLKKKPAA